MHKISKLKFKDEISRFVRTTCTQVILTGVCVRKRHTRIFSMYLSNKNLDSFYLRVLFDTLDISISPCRPLSKASVKVKTFESFTRVRGRGGNNSFAAIGKNPDSGGSWARNFSLCGSLNSKTRPGTKLRETSRLYRTRFEPHPPRPSAPYVPRPRSI